MRKVRIIHWVGLVVSVLLAAPCALADIAADLKQAEEFYQAGQYTQAEPVYLTVINAADPNKPPEFEAALNARKRLPVVYIATARLPEARAAVQDLLAKHSAYEWLPHALHEVVEQARDLNKTAQAGQVYREILNAEPGHAQALWLKMGINLADVYLSDGPAVNAGVQDIIARHRTDPWSAEALAQIGWAYDKVNEHAKARPLYEYVVDNWSDKPRAIYAHTALVRGCIRLRDKPAAQARLEQLTSRYVTNPQLPRVLNEIARGYREAQMYQEARPVSQHILDNYPGHEQRIWAQRDIVLCDIGERSQSAAQTGLQKLVKDYGENGYLAYVLNEIAAGYRQGRMHQQAKPVSQYVLDNFPDSDQCLWAQRDVVLSDLALGNTEAAATGIQQLESRFAKQSGAIWAISEVAEACSKLGRHEQARDLFRFNLYNCPNPDDTIWSLRGFVAESIALRDEASIDAGIKKLLSEYSTSKNLPMAAAHVADSLCRAGHRDASQLFQYVIDNYPDHEQALLAEVGLGHVRLWQDDIQGAEAIYQKVLSDHARHPELAEAVCLMGQGYYEQAELARQQGLSDKAVLNYQAALAKFGLITGASHEIPYDAPFAYHFSGECYHRLGQPDKAVDCYQKVCGSWPDYAYAWHLQFTMAKLYKELIRSGEVTEQEANPKMNAALATVVQKYPGCPASKAANDWLQVAARTREGEQR